MSAEEKTIDIGTRRELFVDDRLIDRMEGTTLMLQRPERREVVFEGGAPWEDNIVGFLSVLEDGDKVRLYYRSKMLDLKNEEDQIIALAESDDRGLSFTRPELGLVEYEVSKKNNILKVGGPPRIPPAFIDTNPACKPDERYKGLSCKWKGLYAMCSPDGLRWRPMTEGPLVMDGTFDTVNTAFWDAQTGCYRCFTRYFENLEEQSTAQDVLGPEPTVVRAIQSSTSQDFVNWTPVVHNEYDDDYGTMQLYTNTARPCPGAEHIYIAFPNRYVQERIKNPDHPYPGVNDALFMSSRDGTHWHRFPEAWVRPGPDELNWTERNNYPAWGIVHTSPTEWSLYISEHYRHAGIFPRLRRLAVRPHGFVSVHASFTGGEMVTKPVTFGGRELRLNYSTSAAGSVRVEVQDEGRQPLPGLALEDMDPIFGDELDAIVQWKNGKDPGSFAGRPVRLRFELKDADLFAFRTEGGR